MELNPSLDLSNTLYAKWKVAEQKAHNKCMSDEERKQRRKESNKKWVEKNKSKVKANQTAWRLANKELRHKQQRERAQNFKRKAIEYCGGCCQQCGGVFPPAVYDFHHINPDEKELLISKMLSHSWENIKKELDKCLLLCANCHRLVHNKELT